MRSLRRPNLDAERVYRTCISRVRSAELKLRLEQIAPLIAEAAKEYHAAGLAGTLVTVLPHDEVGGVTNDELAFVYDGRMVPAGSPGRVFYDEILAAPPFGMCPLCGHRIATTLDHYLPKMAFPSVVVAPNNLVPACKDCNVLKLDQASAEDGEQFLHPYYDAIGTGRWLDATVFETSPASVAFYADPPADWDPALKGRIEFHFKQLGIGELYATQAAVEVSRHRSRLEKLFDVGGSDAVRSHLEGEAETSEKANPNSWQSATFRALSLSDWYCAGGFIPDGD